MRNLTGGIGPDVRLLRQISLRNRVGDARRFCRISTGDVHVHDVGAFSAFHLDAALQRVQGGQGGVGIAGAAVEPERGHQSAQSPLLADKFQILVDRFRADHAAQHAVRHQHPNLTLNLQHGRIVRLISRTKIVSHRVQIRRVDENLRYRRVSMRHDEHE